MIADKKFIEDLNYFLDSALDPTALLEYQRTHSSYNFAQVIQHFAPDWTESEIKRALKIVS